MAYFIGNDSVSFDVDKITIVHWNCCGEDKKTRVDIVFNDGNELYLYFFLDNDYELINDLREHFGYEPLSRVR
jgi:hypothetical protein